MVVFLDFDEDVHDPHADPPSFVFPRSQHHPAVTTKVEAIDEPHNIERRHNPNINGFSAALSCYPVVCQISSSIDLNTLHALSRTCRQIRANLLQYRKQLVAQSLRCENDGNGARLRDYQGTWHVIGEGGITVARLTSGKVGACARDMVSDCRRCGRIVCRNCTLKSPSASLLQRRHRRLCPTCLACPLLFLTSTPAFTPSTPRSFTTPAFTRSSCTCSDSVFLCQPCGHALFEKDTSYSRIWTWRAKYSRLGTGIGEGNEGVKCGRGEDCAAAKEVEVEIDCGGAEERASPSPTSSASSLRSGSSRGNNDLSLAEQDGTIGESNATGGINVTEREEEKAGYWRQEVEGIGGVVKKKVKKMVRVGRTVREYEDERESGMYLGREIRGESRSWCGWCERVIMGRKDLDAAG